MNPLLSIPGYSPSDLQDLGLLPLVYFQNRTLTVGRSLPAERLPASRIQEPASELQTLTPAPNLNASTPCSSVHFAPSVLKKPRSKISRLPKPIQTNPNTMLASGCPYMDIIRYLNTHGFPAFNKVNLNTWKKTGFQNWRTGSETGRAVVTSPACAPSTG